ncbi:hypothetical protein DPMN_016397 [Dreissena polymorpha]|uniref:Uncharacterized protein n=1 Tax=Dreissena polymorpha TaxID=45954 RepID=A0A9D4N9M5_DREPO|nr:hypothetical protein DPMN_016397 [Dreissena polymorpha]
MGPFVSASDRGRMASPQRWLPKIPVWDGTDGDESIPLYMGETNVSCFPASCLVVRSVADRCGPVCESRDIARVYSASQTRALPAGAISLRYHLANGRWPALKRLAEVPVIYTSGNKPQACPRLCERD